MRLWWWRKVRRANIGPVDRDTFERFGEPVIATVLASGLNPRPEELQQVYNNPSKLKAAESWLTEQADLREQHEQRLETLEWAILIFVILGVVADGLLAAHEFGWLR